MSIVRLAGPADEAALFALLMKYKADNSAFGFQVDDARVAEHVLLGTRGQGGLHGVIDAPDKPGAFAGSIGIIFDRFWFSSDWGLGVIWLFVDPPYRPGTHYADALVAWAKEKRTAFEASAGHQIRMANSVISETRLEPKLRYWRKHSGKMIGGIFEVL